MYGNGVNPNAWEIAGGRMSSGNRCPPARYSKANRMKINVATSRTQKASNAIVNERKNCSSAVKTSEIAKAPIRTGSVGTTKYSRCQRMNNATGTAATMV